jgi:hypothetical protein
MRLRRRQTRGKSAKAKVIRQTRTKGVERPSRCSVEARVCLGEDGSPRPSLSWEMAMDGFPAQMQTPAGAKWGGDLSRDSRPSRYSLAGPAAPPQRPCTSTDTLGALRPHVSAISAIRPIASTTTDPPRPHSKRATTTTLAVFSIQSFHTSSTAPPHLRPYLSLTTP